MPPAPARPKRVCVVGAGPAGLVAAKTLLYDYAVGAFEVTVFNKGTAIGGLWPPASCKDVGRINPDMRINLSRHTVCFSDLAWPAGSVTHPKAWEVGEYLEAYLRRFNRIDVRHSCNVLSTTRIVDHDDKVLWRVKVGQGSDFKEEEEHEFDHLIVASGFFGTQNLIDGHLPSQGVRTLHSSKFRQVAELLSTDEAPPEDAKIVVAGGSISGAEVAADIASQLSSARHSAGESRIPHAERYKVYHVFPRPFWIVPYFTPVNSICTLSDGAKTYNSAPDFVPLDLKSRLEDRPEGPLVNRSGQINAEAALAAHASFRSIVGSDQADIGGSATCPNPVQKSTASNSKQGAPWMVISDTYAEFVRSGLIVPVNGRLVSTTATDAQTVYRDVRGEHLLDKVAARVLATGFDSSQSLSYLPQDVLKALEFDPMQTFNPLVLHMHNTTSTKCPDLGFVGFYRGPYWGVMEMQARYLGALWSGHADAVAALHGSTTPVPRLRDLFSHRRHELSQFPSGDHAYIIEDFATILGLSRSPPQRHGCVVPFRYPPANADKQSHEECESSLQDMHNLLNESTHGVRFVARAVFRAMQGDWRLDRTITSHSEHPSGKLIGIASFHPRQPTDSAYEREYLYIEEGSFETTTGFTFRANRRYVHRYDLLNDKLSIWFTKADNLSVDYLFHEFEFLRLKEGSRKRGWGAKAHHLCIKDTYDVEYEFHFDGASLKWWTMAYDVHGPEKDYRIESRYERAQRMDLHIR